MQGVNGISALPRSLQTLVQATEYPPERPTLMQTTAPKVVMIVDSVSPTPFALLRRANHFHYRDSDWVLQQFSDYDDPVKALTDECRRVLTSISSTNDSMVSSSKLSTSLGDTSWSRFEDIGFRGLGDESDNEDDTNGSAYGRKPPRQEGLRSTPRSKNDLGRPTTPSWADFLSTGFVDESGNKGPAPLLLPPDKILPPIETNPSRGQSSHSHLRMKDDGSTLEPGELASISSLDLDDAFWWVWMTSLAGEEPTERKAVFGRCAVVETNIRGGKWLVMEEMVKGAAPEPDGGAYIAEKKSIFGFSRRGRMTRSKTTKKTPMLKAEPYSKIGESTPTSKTNIGPDQHAKIQAAAAALQQKQAQQDVESVGLRRARAEDAVSTKTNSVFTLQPVLMSEAAPAMKWANSYDKNAIRAAYLGNNFTGRGSSADLLSPNAASFNVGASTNGSSTPVAKPGPLRETTGNSAQASGHDRKLPALPPSQSDVGLASTAGDRTPTQAAAPLPVAPPKDIRAENQAASEAAQVPLPSATPIEYPRPMERSPQPSRENIHPQQAQPQEPIPQAPSTPETARRQPITDGNSPSSPESKKAAKKLQKKGGAGFKGMFGKSKSNVPRPAPISPSSNSTAVAAARAALQPQQPQQAPPVRKPPPQASVGRRFSGIGRKKAPQVAAQTFTAPVQDFDEGSPAPTAEPSLVSTRPPYNSQHNDYNDSQASLSRVDTNEQRHADREFRAFDQGPLEDQPAFVPQDDSQRESFVSDVPPDDETEHEGNDHVEQDDVSEKSDDLTRRDSPQDRWAQIRKNAAERAARQSEEQSRPSQADRTDDGETSGEESKFSPGSFILGDLTVVKPSNLVLLASRRVSLSSLETWRARDPVADCKSQGIAFVLQFFHSILDF